MVLSPFYYDILGLYSKIIIIILDFSMKDMLVKRQISDKIREKLFSKKAIILIGPRQSGKTTLIKDLLSGVDCKILSLNADEDNTRETLKEINIEKIKSIIGDHRILFIDEAQRVANIGLFIKVIVDNIKDVQVIATGSSSIELLSNIKEPLTGRKYEYHLHTFSFSEMCAFPSTLQEQKSLEERLIYGYYPEIVRTKSGRDELLHLLCDSYLYKDILLMDSINKPVLIQKLLKALALQVGSEVSLNELSNLVGADNKTIAKYIDLLKKSFVIFSLHSYSGNLRNEITKGQKIYFYDNGIRNAIIGNLNMLSSRTDVGALWENFIISERLKKNSNTEKRVESYFWRTTQQQEIDYIEIIQDQICAYEFTFNPKAKKRISKTFTGAYPKASVEIINSHNFPDFLL